MECQTFLLVIKPYENPWGFACRFVYVVDREDIIGLAVCTYKLARVRIILG
jgi:hypothetical protein